MKRVIDKNVTTLADKSCHTFVFPAPSCQLRIDDFLTHISKSSYQSEIDLHNAPSLA
jgi:hypothetical protein